MFENTKQKIERLESEKGVSDRPSFLNDNQYIEYLEGISNDNISGKRESSKVRETNKKVKKTL